MQASTSRSRTGGSKKFLDMIPNAYLVLVWFEPGSGSSYIFDMFNLSKSMLQLISTL